MLQLRKLQQSSLCFFLSVALHSGYYTLNPRNLCPKKYEVGIFKCFLKAKTLPRTITPL